MKAEIIPAILEKSFADVSRRLDQVSGLAKTVQIDICDGVFVPSTTWPFITAAQYDKSLNMDERYKSIARQEAEMPHWEDFDFELDLMVADAKRLLPDLLTLGPLRVFFHAEAFTDLFLEVEDACKLLPTIVEPGIAIDAGTDPETLFELLDQGVVTSVQCMGIAHDGVQGEPFDERVLANLRALRARYPNLPLSVDGAVNKETIPRLVEAGATRLVCGSAVFSSDDVAARVKELQAMVQ